MPRNLDLPLIGIVAAALRRTGSSTGDVKRLVSLTALASIPRTAPKRRKNGPQQGLLITRMQTDSAFCEAYRLLRLKLLRQLKDEDKVIMVTSSIPSEGKSSVSVNLALSLAREGKKVLLANQAGALWTEITAILPADRSVLMVWMGILAFAFQIYFDFSGYSDMAVGMGHMLGFHFPENFNYPYISKSITEFWRRWHISLGTWFKEYVYIPLGGNRKGGLLQVRNILVVWLLTGIWHGASVNFLLWGIYFGLLLLLEKFVLMKYLKKLPSLLQCTYAFLLVLLGWVLFAFEDMGQGFQYLLQMTGAAGLSLCNERTIFLLSGNLVLLAACALGSTPLPARAAGRWKDRVPEPLFLGLVLLLSVAYLVNATYNPFLYFRF